MCDVLTEVENRGIARGIQQSRKIMITNMLANGITIEVVAKCANLSVDEVQAI